jgi:ectoine hydroxylase-related dioxygenase (phytanoyl-CoA dioxygenase family)
VIVVDCKQDSDWLDRVSEGLYDEGFAIVTRVLDSSFLEKTRESMYRVQERARADIGEDRLRRAGELGVLRLMSGYDLFFLKFLEISELLSVVDRTISPTSILHTQNGFILPSFPAGEAPTIFQNSFHQDFPRVLNGYIASINVMFAIDEFLPENGATLVVPRSHQGRLEPDQRKFAETAIAIECPSGSMLVFDSTLWHAAGANTSGKDRLAINHQFTRSYIKQQIDYVRALGDECVLAQQPRTQQLLGWYTRVVTSLDEFYRPEQERLYRRGQG